MLNLCLGEEEEEEVVVVEENPGKLIPRLSRMQDEKEEASFPKVIFHHVMLGVMRYYS